MTTTTEKQATQKGRTPFKSRKKRATPTQLKPWPCSRMLTPGEAEALRLGLTAEQIGQKSGGISAGYVKRILAKGCDDEYRLEAVERTLSLLGKLTAHPKRTISRKLLLAASIGAAKKMKSDEEEPNTTHLRLD